METKVETTLTIPSGPVSPALLTSWLGVLPKDAEITFIVSAAVEDRFHYTPARVSGIRATWKQQFNG